jgi:anti-anti-sigma regulatory factor
MRASLVCESRVDPPLVVVRVAGLLTLATAAQLRMAGLKALVEEPQAVLLDVRELTLTDDVHLTVLSALARHAAAWPSIPIIVCGPHPALTAAVTRLAIDRQVIVCADLDEGRRQAAKRPLPDRIVHTFPPLPSSAALARAVAVNACDAWRLGHLIPSAELVVTELVSNAIRHARTTFELAITRTGRSLHLAVRDYATPLAELVGPAGETEPGGRGLIIVEAVSTCWGCTSTRDGKVTWATMSSRR